MAFVDALNRHADQIRMRMNHCQGEEAAKQALVVPLLHVLGYDVFDPREVTPEYVADFAVKKQGQFEKVDYALFLEGSPIAFIECKAVGAALEDHDGQLSRYFNATPSVRLAFITDGVRLRAFTDLRTPNIMDPKPWLSVDLLELKPAEIDALRRFRKSDFSADEIIGLAEEMVYYNTMVEYLGVNLREPSENFVRFIATEIQASTRVTSRIVERLAPILKKAIQATIIENVARSFEARKETSPPSEAATKDASQGRTPALIETPDAKPGIVTTEDELEAHRLVESWVKEIFPEAPVTFRDSKTYFAINQDNVRKWFLRGNLDRVPGWIGLRHITLDEASRLAPGVEATDSGFPEGCKFIVPEGFELSKLRAAIIMSYSREADRTNEEALTEAQGS